ncbi:MAG: hypothetical protein R3F35_20110 [Myxococcota bacterium]
MRTTNAMRNASIVHLPSLVLLAALSVALSSACASGPSLRHKHEFNLSPGNEHHAGIKKALLLPLDATNEKPVSDLDVAHDRIEALVEAHLESKGLVVERIDPRRFAEAQKAAHAAIRAQRLSGASGTVSAYVDFEDIVPALVDALELDADVVLEANLVMRDAHYQGKRMLVWDGVRRRETVRYLLSMEGEVPAASLYVAVHSKEGKRLFSGYGGFEPIFRVERAARKYVRREDLFEDERNLREGICIAFYPWFGMAEYCAR